MHSHTLLLALASTAAALAPGHIAARLEARQTANTQTATQTEDSLSCSLAFAAIATKLPSSSNEVHQQQCGEEIPASLSSEWSSYESAFKSWQTEYLDKFSSLADDCPTFKTDYEKLTGDLCPTTSTSASVAAPTQTGGGNGTDAGAGNNGGSNNNADPGKNAGHRETGLVGFAVAVAGFLGVMAVL